MTTRKRYTPAEIAQLLKSHITQEFAYDRPDFVLTNEFKLIEERLVDSMGIFQLVTFIEEAFGIAWEPEELVLKNFESIDHLTAFIHSKTGETVQ